MTLYSQSLFCSVKFHVFSTSSCCICWLFNLYLYKLVNLLFSDCFATGYIHSGEIKIFRTFCPGCVSILLLIYFGLLTWSHLLTHPPPLGGLRHFDLRITASIIELDSIAVHCASVKRAALTMRVKCELHATLFFFVLMMYTTETARFLCINGNSVLYF